MSSILTLTRAHIHRTEVWAAIQREKEEGHATH